MRLGPTRVTSPAESHKKEGVVDQLSHLSTTYRQLRLMAGATLFVLPVVIVLWGYLVEPRVQPTLSHYYFFQQTPGAVRTLFTGFLIFVGGIMIAYRGFDGHDNWVHNAAGLAAICVAMIPKVCDKDGAERYCTRVMLSPLHGPAAAVMFCFAGYAVLYGGGSKFKSHLDAEEMRILRKAQAASLVTMAAGAGLYLLRLVLPQLMHDFRVTMLVIEMLGFFGFGGYWLVVTYLVGRSNKRVHLQGHKADRPAPEKGSPKPAAPQDSGPLL